MHALEFEWVGGVPVESWVEASSCLCERVFIYMTAIDYGQSTEHICETLWVKCNGEAPEGWGSFEVFEELSKPLFIHGSGSKGMRLRLRSRMVVCLGSLLSRTCKFLWKRVQG